MERNTETIPPLFCSLVGSEFRERLDWIAALNRTALLDAIIEPFTIRGEQAGVCGCASGSACKGETYDSN